MTPGAFRTKEIQREYKGPFLPNKEAAFREQFGTGLIRPDKTLSSGAPLFLLDFSSAIFFPQFRLPLLPTNCPWVTKDDIGVTKSRRGLSFLEFFTQISKRSRSYFKRNSTNHAALGIIGSGGSRPSAKEGGRF